MNTDIYTDPHVVYRNLIVRHSPIYFQCHHYVRIDIWPTINFLCKCNPAKPILSSTLSSVPSVARKANEVNHTLTNGKISIPCGLPDTCIHIQATIWQLGWRIQKKAVSTLYNFDFPVKYRHKFVCYTNVLNAHYNMWALPVESRSV